MLTRYKESGPSSMIQGSIFCRTIPLAFGRASLIVLDGCRQWPVEEIGLYNIEGPFAQGKNKETLIRCSLTEIDWRIHLTKLFHNVILVTEDFPA
jgi:hypothetical protein